MKVSDIMTAPPQTCHLHTELATASGRMQQTGTGALVVLDNHGKVAGVVTDRDLAMAIVSHPRGTGHRSVEQVMSRHLRTCKPDDAVQDALLEMSRHGLRRLPVVTSDGDLKGVVSIDDIILWGVNPGATTQHELIAALRRICAARTAAPEPELPRLY
jgi:CBS domain-containing protein